MGEAVIVALITGGLTLLGVMISNGRTQAVLETTLLNNPAWQSLTAVQEGRYYVMDPNLYNLKPNARWGEAYEQLADVLYPAG